MKMWLRVRLLVVPALFSIGCFQQGTKPAASSEAEPKNTVLNVTEWAALSKPGPSHQLLDLFAGEWDTRIRFWKDPSAAPESSQGRSVAKWILGHRFLKEEFQGEVAGEKFQGFGIMGYDNGAHRFVNVWMDSLNTTLATAIGRYFAEQNRFEFVGEVFDPFIGGPKKTRSEIQVQSQNQYEFRMYDVSDGKEYKALEMIYTRR